MAVGDITGGMKHDVNINLGDELNTASSAVEGTVGEGGVSYTSESFAGMQGGNIPEFKEAIKRYRQQAHDTIEGFNTEIGEDVLNTIRGSKVGDSVNRFIAQIKVLLKAYIDAVEFECDAIDEALKNYESAQASLSGQVEADVSSVEGAVKSIRQASSHVDVDPGAVGPIPPVAG